MCTLVERLHGRCRWRHEVRWSEATRWNWRQSLQEECNWCTERVYISAACNSSSDAQFAAKGMTTSRRTWTSWLAWPCLKGIPHIPDACLSWRFFFFCRPMFPHAVATFITFSTPSQMYTRPPILHSPFS